MRRVLVVTVALSVAFVGAEAQTKRPPARRPAAKAPARTPAAKPVKNPADAKCPSVLGTGAVTKRVFCDVMSGPDPAVGIVIAVPPHRGTVRLTFDLHNRHTYSEEQVRARKAFARYTATVAVLAPDGTIIDRGVVQSEFRAAADAFDRVSGGAGPSGMKAVVPTGVEHVTVTLPEDLTTVSIVGEKLTTERLEGAATYTSPGRPIAIVSNIQVEYKPAPAKRKR